MHHEDDYDNIAKKYGVEELEHEHEASLDTDYGHIFFLKNFPNHTSPFWNMKQNDVGKHAYKVDVILHGVETIGSAQRSSSIDEMREMFYSISNGQYANILFSNFTKERVETELNEFLSHDFFDRSGGGIGVTRLIKAMKLSNLLE
jgi:aspartyl/asparaginyl-tRNA synthetase